MTSLVTIFITSFIIAFSGAMMPGPLMTVTISESIRNGIWAGPKLIAGHAILEIALIAGILFGLTPLLQNETFFIIVALAGGGIMLWMAGGMIGSLKTLQLTGNTEAKRQNNLYMSGILMSLANPYWIIWWATIGLGYILSSMKYGTTGIIFFFFGHILGDLVWYSGISFAVGKGRELFTNKTYRILVGSCAAFLIAFALWLIYDGSTRMI
ncbi:MAG: LysE family transporter [Chlorobi bacterium]|nr:LysE family transporter [Chlorobiota bacterium]